MLWSSRTKRPRQEEDARAQNTNNFNDNLNNKTIFSLNATNRAGRFFLCIDFFPPERFSLFARSVGDEKCGEEYFWLLWHAMLAVRSPRKIYQNVKPEILVEAAFSPSRESILFLKNFTKKQKSFFTPAFAALFFARRAMFGFRSPPAQLRPWLLMPKKLSLMFSHEFCVLRLRSPFLPRRYHFRYRFKSKRKKCVCLLGRVVFARNWVKIRSYKA